jgi:hypothetical protein
MQKVVTNPQFHLENKITRTYSRHVVHRYKASGPRIGIPAETFTQTQ